MFFKVVWIVRKMGVAFQHDFPIYDQSKCLKNTHETYSLKLEYNGYWNK